MDSVASTVGGVGHTVAEAARNPLRRAGPGPERDFTDAVDAQDLSRSCPVTLPQANQQAPTFAQPAPGQPGAPAQPPQQQNNQQQNNNGIPSLQFVGNPGTATRESLAITGTNPVRAGDGSSITAIYNLAQVAPGSNAYQPTVTSAAGSEARNRRFRSSPRTKCRSDRCRMSSVSGPSAGRMARRRRTSRYARRSIRTPYITHARPATAIAIRIDARTGGESTVGDLRGRRILVDRCTHGATT